MRTRIGQLVLLLILGLGLMPMPLLAQEWAPPSPLWPIPLGDGERFPETGLFLAGEFKYMRQTNPLRRQDIAFRGFFDADGSITGNPGSFLGSHSVALNSRDVSGPVSRQPGFGVTAGWRFADGTAFLVDVWHLQDARYSATASLIPPNFLVGGDLADSFLSSPVFNFPSDFAGPANDVGRGSPDAGYGIWNAASLMTIDFIQRFDMVHIYTRIPIDEGSDTWRCWGMVGGRAVVMFERFKWRTVNLDNTGGASPADIAIYSNTVSNRMYGASVGLGGEWYWGSSPLGAFACSLDGYVTLALDLVKERAKYERLDRFMAATRAINEYTLAPMVQVDANLWWYPTRGIQCRLGWDLLAIFNTVSAPHPVDFNYGRLTPGWERGTTRILRGMHIGVAFIF